MPTNRVAAAIILLSFWFGDITGSLYRKISSDPVALLRGLDIEHPVGTLVLEALEVK